MDQRRLANWIESYLHFTRHSESPECFHKWTALAMLSIAINRNCWMDRGYYRTFPSLYVLFVGPSGIGKSESSGIGLELLREAALKIHIFKDFITTAGIIEFMSASKVSMEVAGKIIHKTPVMIYASELGTLINSRAGGVRELTMLLTELFNKSVDHEDRTSKRKLTLIKNPSLTFFAGCFPEWIEEELVSISLRSGFFGRILVVSAYTKRHLNPNIQLTTADLQLREDLIHDLSLIGNLYGEMEWDDGTQTIWEKWYRAQPKDLDSDETIEVKGFTSRRAQFVQRLAMLSSISRNSSLNLNTTDFNFGLTSIAECEQNTRNLKIQPIHMVHALKLRKSILSIQKKRETNIVSLRELTMYTFKSLSKKDREEGIEQLCSIGFCKLVGRKIEILDEKVGS